MYRKSNNVKCLSAFYLFVKISALRGEPTGSGKMEKKMDKAMKIKAPKKTVEKKSTG